MYLSTRSKLKQAIRTSVPGWHQFDLNWSGASQRDSSYRPLSPKFLRLQTKTRPAAQDSPNWLPTRNGRRSNRMTVISINLKGTVALTFMVTCHFMLHMTDYVFILGIVTQNHITSSQAETTAHVQSSTALLQFSGTTPREQSYRDPRGHSATPANSSSSPAAPSGFTAAGQKALDSVSTNTGMTGCLEITYPTLKSTLGG